MTTETIIHKLKDDVHYYGEFGKQFLSYSSIGTLLNDPKKFGQDVEKTSAMLKGSYFHHAMLEPEKVAEYIIIDSNTRTTKVYKEAVLEHGTDLLLLAKERDELEAMVTEAKKNFRFCSDIYEDGNRFEVPSIKNIMGYMWKGKADVLASDKVIDIKTTSRLSDFKFSSRKYNYDAQAWLYNQLFGRRMVFYVIEKETFNMCIFECDDSVLERGKDKVKEAVKVYEQFFGKSATDDIHQYIKEDILY